MSALIKSLQSVLSPRLAVSGKIIREEGGRYHVATPKGVRVCSNGTNTAFKIGDTVRLVDTAIVGGVPNEDDLPVFSV